MSEEDAGVKGVEVKGVQVEGERLLSPPELAEVLGVSLRTLWRMIQRGDVPTPIRYNRKLTRWKRSAIDEYLSGL